MREKSFFLQNEENVTFLFFTKSQLAKPKILNVDAKSAKITLTSLYNEQTSLPKTKMSSPKSKRKNKKREASRQCWHKPSLVSLGAGFMFLKESKFHGNKGTVEWSKMGETDKRKFKLMVKQLRDEFGWATNAVTNDYLDRKTKKVYDGLLRVYRRANVDVKDDKQNFWNATTKVDPLQPQKEVTLSATTKKWIQTGVDELEMNEKRIRQIMRELLPDYQNKMEAAKKKQKKEAKMQDAWHHLSKQLGKMEADESSSAEIIVIKRKMQTFIKDSNRMPANHNGPMAYIEESSNNSNNTNNAMNMTKKKDLFKQSGKKRNYKEAMQQITESDIGTKKRKAAWRQREELMSTKANENLKQVVDNSVKELQLQLAENAEELKKDIRKKPEPLATDNAFDIEEPDSPNWYDQSPLNSPLRFGFDLD